MNNLAIIPARAGSKRIPNKNIKYFCGTPLVTWSIKQALHTKSIDLTIVTSDSDQILDEDEIELEIEIIDDD